MDKAGIYLSFYGDDFTGSTDVMESLTLNGIPAALFLQVPSGGEVQEFELKNKSLTPSGKLKAFGVAGISRTMTPAEMTNELPEIFEKISKIPSKIFHYKICSTLDSSPDIGNIGHAVEIALKYFPSSFIPLLVGAPDLNRFCIFGNIFARAEGKTYRLDRHPTMSRHPITPMSESDVRMHLSSQTNRNIHLLDLLDLDGPFENSHSYIRNLLSATNPEYLLFDVLNHAQLKKVGQLLDENLTDKTQLIVGSSAVENALSANLQEKKSIDKPPHLRAVGKAEKLIIMAGSCSPTTRKQIEWAITKDFEEIRINTVKLTDPQLKAEELERVIFQATRALHHRNVVLYTAMGPDDPGIQHTKKKFDENPSRHKKVGDLLGQIQGLLLREILKGRSGIRVVVAGGDTSGHAAKALDIYALEVLVPIAPGAPLCLAHSKNPLFDGIQIALKGGQNGNEKYFESILMGELLT